MLFCSLIRRFVGFFLWNYPNSSVGLSRFFAKTIEFMFAGINSITIIITLEGIEKKKTEKNDNKTV